ncbi:MAG: hypothetical protein J6Y78_17345 [Paludibacteraceae bacterium]|nr:hypothetical protein [Paludibacteraceae bacterium]
MSKIIYYIGAGASYGRKEAREVLDEGTGSERLIIHEGLPVVSEITKSLLTFKKAVEEVKIEEQNSYLFMDGMDMYKSHGSNIINWQIELIRDIDELYKASMEHATIDTYAKKLILTRMENKFKRLKHVLSAFFVWVQLEGKVDTRYDTFLANILQINDLNFPQEISIISWNYDSQFELAYKNFNPEGSLPIYEKTVDGNFPPLNNYGRIFKVNGSANFSDFNIVNFINKHDVKPIIQLIEYYGNLYADTSELGFQLHSHLSFAWETSEKQDQLMEAIKQTTKDTESIVVIGYSFPFFNREIDRKIFVGMPNLKTIYIQDPYPDAVEQSLKAVLPEGSKVKIEHQKDCTQFYLPREL